ncbi:MAG: thioredoxin family protein [Bacteroidales bacterium]|nr:thioredoxin family protein [Bacteroidales bacterium]
MLSRNRLISAAAALLWSVAAFAQLDTDNAVRWRASSRQIEGDLYEIVLTGNTTDNWHTYSTTAAESAIYAEYPVLEGCELEGGLYDITEPQDFQGDPVFFGKFQLGQKVRLKAPSANITVVVTWIACDRYCTSPTDTELKVTVKNPEIGTTSPDNKNVLSGNKAVLSSEIQDIDKEESNSSLLALIIEAILWGLAMLLTPCVFPMVPMTISFFLKGSSNPAVGRFKALMYGLFIVLLYTVPISVIILITRIAGGETVTADIFNWLATHWIPNLIFFVVFMIFAASFFGAFEITLPSSIVNKSDKNANRTGLAGVFFMALTLVLVSFSCTGPIVGTVLIKSTQGEFWTPMVTMLAFSTAFALPFTVLAMFPSLLKKMKSGSWMNSVKVVLGFIEIALGFKFLSVADQTYHWGILDREVYLAIWIVVFSLLGLYLLGKIRFKNDSPEAKPLSVFRLALVIAVFSFVVYLIPGMWGAPLKALSGYLPPIETQDFIITGGYAQPQEQSSENGLKLPLGLTGYFNMEEAQAEAARVGKPVFVDITGHGCVNCREMEQRVLSDPRILEKLRNEFVVVALYTDDKTKLEEKDWITTDKGKVLKDLGRVNSYIVRTRFGVNAQPNYTIVSPEGKQLVPVRGYDLDIDGYLAFLDSGIAAYKASR